MPATGWLLASGILLALSYPPLGSPVFPFVALVPLFLFVEGAPDARRLLRGGMLLGIFFWVSHLYWVTLFLFHQAIVPVAIAGFLAMILYLAAYTALFVLGLGLLWRRMHLPLWLVAPALMVSLEALRSVGELAFPWGELCYAVTRHPILIQTAEWAGPHGVTFWIVLVGTLVYGAIRARRGVRSIFLAALLTVTLLPILYGRHCLGRSDLLDGEEIPIALIQPGIEQDRKWNSAFRDSTMQILDGLTADALESGPRFVVWPETAVPAYLRHNAAFRGEVGRIARDGGVPILTGAQDFDRMAGGGYQAYNAAFFFHADGRMDERRYAKIRLVPFGEKVPFESFFPALKGVNVGGGHFTAGEEFTLFPAPHAPFGVLICFESIFPDLARAFCRRGAAFLLNITNDAWFGRTAAPYQHAAALPLRAVENRVWAARAANTGISMIVDPLGRISGETPIFMRTFVAGSIRARAADTFYLRHGDWIVGLSLILLIGGIIFRGTERLRTRGLRGPARGEKSARNRSQGT